ncbi:MAG: prolyl oligopeptidase family serine peptidase [Alteromonadaceae bacterium]
MNVDKIITYNTPGETDEDHIYLEEVLGEKALADVNNWNTQTLERLMADPLFNEMNNEVLEIVNSKDKIPYVSFRGGEVHNFWQDEQHERGVWRKSSLPSYLSDSPVWETVLDFDLLSKIENKNWVYKGNNCLSPDYELCIVSLSDGGKDAVVNREFNTKTKSFVNNGFVTQESKGSMDWIDKDTTIIGVDFGENTMTDSGYPMVSKIWKRGTPLSSAVEIDRGKKADVGYWGGVTELSDGRREIFTTRAITFYNTEYYWFPLKSDGSSSTKVKLPVPEKSNLSGEFKGQILLKLNENWCGFTLGDLVSFSINDFMKNGKIDHINLVFSPDEKSSIGNFGVTQSKVLMSIYLDVKGSAYEFDWDGHNWTSSKLAFPSNGSVSIGSTNNKEEVAFISAESFLNPDTLYTYNTATGEKAQAKSLPSWFDAENMVSEQFFVASTDGTQVPYFVVRGKNTKMNGKNPTLLYGYGGFEVSLNPSYSATRGKLWLERGGIYVLANIRGGGEYGPKWHQAGLKTQRQRIYDDFIAVAEDLIAKNMTSPHHLGIEGGSNGGLLMGVMFTQRPDLFNAVICAVPLLDMLRYHTLLAGASWMGEYGDPENEIEGNFLRSISPYHNIDPDAEYPEVFFITSTKDDRVHPGHARKVAKRMEDQGHKLLYYENIDGGHSAAANLKETAKRITLQHTYLMQKLSNN